jgi:hypothetical protein
VVFFAHATCKSARFLQLKLNNNLFARHLTNSWVILLAPCAPSPQQETQLCVAAFLVNVHRICAYLLTNGDAALPQQNHHKARRVES